MTANERYAVTCARLRLPAAVAGTLMLLAGTVLDVPVLAAVGFAVMVVGFALYFRVGTLRRPPVAVRPPVTGRWEGINSPASKVPSHGVHAYGQTYAIDIVHAPEGLEGPAVGTRPGMAPAAEFPSFGQPVLAVADGVVVRARDRERDHRGRGGLALAWFVLAGFVRELSGPSRVLGNHVVIDIGGTYALVAHLKRGSVLVRPGDRVVAGQQVAECGNTGNSTEPHVHLQLMESPRAWLAAGVPFAFVASRLEGEGGADGVPANGQRFVADQPVESRDAAEARGSVRAVVEQFPRTS